jgi:sulfonate transport system substrate-binding protein
MDVHSRRNMLRGAAALGLTLATGPTLASSVVRIGYQKYGNLLLLKVSGMLDQRLKTLGWSVDWKLFLSGPPLMEALAAGAIDYGLAGETPPIFAQAAGVPLVYLGYEPPSPHGEAILVLDRSPIRTMADLKGKRVAFNKGSNVHYLYVRALAKAGLAPDSVHPLYLTPPDARAAFERGSVDAWVIWDPFLAAAQAALPTRTIADGTDIVANRQFYLGRRGFADQAVYGAIRQAIIDIDRQTVGDPGKAADLLSPPIGLPPATLATALKRQSWAYQDMTADVAKDQQAIADTFLQLGLIPRAIKISDALPHA